jgi:hypothetical protein
MTETEALLTGEIDGGSTGQKAAAVESSVVVKDVPAKDDKDHEEDDDDDLFATDDEVEPQSNDGSKGATEVSKSLHYSAETATIPSAQNSGTSIPRKQNESSKDTNKKAQYSGTLLAAHTSNNANNTASQKFGLPNGVIVPSTVTAKLLQGKLLETLKSLPVNLINDALTEYHDAIQFKGAAIRNHGAYLLGVVKRYVAVQDRAQSGILPMGDVLTPAVQERIKKLVSSGFCTDGKCKCCL